MNSIGRPSSVSSSPSPLPLVRLILTLPFVQALDESRAESILETHGLSRKLVDDPDQFVPIGVVHQMLEDAAAAAEDPYLGARLGEVLDFTTWSPLVEAAAHAASLSDFLTRFIMAARDDASSADHSLEIRGVFATFRETRVAKPTITPAQNDAFTASYLLSILRWSVGSKWEPKEVQLRVCEPSALPEGYRDLQILRGDDLGVSIRFPSEWLTRPIDRKRSRSSTSPPAEIKHPPTSLVEGLRLALLPHLGNPDLGVDRVAALIGMSRQSLQRRLAAEGTSLTQEIASLRMQRALERLAATDQPIASIGEELGFDNPTSFSRAFKAWTGQSPRAFRAESEHQRTSADPVSRNRSDLHP